ncbi:hypothetical protein [Algoriphagus namhaensis]
MENLKIKKLKDLTENELVLTNGGSWLRWSPPFWPAYLVVEILEGVQRGLTADCNEVCPSQTSEGC